VEGLLRNISIKIQVFYTTKLYLLILILGIFLNKVIYLTQILVMYSIYLSNLIKYTYDNSNLEFFIQNYYHFLKDLHQVAQILGLENYNFV